MSREHLRVKYDGLDRAQLLAERDRERELADALGRALQYVSEQVPLGHYHGPMAECVACKVDEALRQWREARKGDSGHVEAP